MWAAPLGLGIYELRATKDGTYPVYDWGKLDPTGTIDLKKSDVWKIGETSNFRTNKAGTQVQNYIQGISPSVLLMLVGEGQLKDR